MEFRRVHKTWYAATHCLFLTALMVAGSIGATDALGAGGKVSSTWLVRANPARIVNGTPIFLQVTPPVRLKSLTGRWLGHEIVFEHGSGRTWVALAGVSLETKPGSYPLVLDGITVEGSQNSFRKGFAVGHAKYPVIQLTVSKQFTEPSPEQLQVIKEDQDLKHKAFSVTTPERVWSGTPVAAVNSGTVILARPLYFEGNCVVLDHGQGLLSIYLHLSEIKVKEGERVTRGQLLGLSGATGRATGPHLHIAVRWQGVYLSPAVLLSLRLPESQAKN